MTTEVPGYVSPKATPAPPPLAHISTSWARIR